MSIKIKVFASWMAPVWTVATFAAGIVFAAGNDARLSECGRG